MTTSLSKIICDRCAPLPPKPTDTEPVLQPLPSIRAVLFDIYGTLVVSDSGDVGGRSMDRKQAALGIVTSELGVKLDTSLPVAIDVFEDAIRQDHAASKQAGVEYPEVDIVEIWQRTLDQTTGGQTDGIDFERFALEFELRVNPVWPMPELEPTIAELRQSGQVLGIVSNAQFFTPLLFPALVGRSLKELGFLPSVSLFSFAHRHAKPGRYLYELAKDRLVPEGITATEVLYVGNDMLNDVAAAASVGFRTALFAGDQRSLRWRREDPRTRDVTPDVVVTRLSQLTGILRAE